MKNFIVKFLAVATVVASIAAVAPSALAGGGGIWTDISDKIAERANRPVWVMAYAAPYWYLTDGQDLWNGGHVWKTESSAMADITLDVRNAGISRVDDIVSDGQTVLFMQYVAVHSNMVQMSAYNGNYQNLTSNLRNQLRSDEGLSQVIGRDGTWFLMTTQGRLFKMTSSGSFTRIYLPNNYESTVNSMAYYGRMNYQVGSASMSANNALTMLPIAGGKWILVARGMGPGSSVYNSAVYVYDGSNFTQDSDLTWEANYASTIATNGNDILTTGCHVTNFVNCGIHYYKGSQKQYVSVGVNGATNVVGPEMKAVWNGSNWLLLNGKHLASFDGTTVQSLADTTNIFLTMAGNGNGVTLFGGAASDANSGNNPSNPLTAKLVRYNANGTNTSSSGSFGGGMTYSSSAGPNVTTSGNPSNYTINNGETFIYRATASDSNGVNRVSLYVDGSLAKTCYSDTCEYSNVYYSNSLSTRNIPVYAIAMDNQGYTTQTSQETLKVQGTSSSNQQNSTQNSSSGTYYWSYFDPNQTTLQRGNTMTYNVGANDSDGLKKIELYVNGQLKRTCDLGRSYGNHVCGQTIYGTDYLSGSSLALNARVLDYLDKETWVPVQTIYITDNNGSNTTGDISTWTWLDPSGSTLNRTSNTTFKVQASATQGLNTMEVYVNGNLKRTCNFSRVYGTQSCDLTIYGSDYSNGSVLSLNARATDYNGKTAWSDNKSLTVQDNGSVYGDISISDWFEPWGATLPSVATLRRGGSTTYQVTANANQGLNTVEIYIDGTLKRTCNYSRAYGSQVCNLSVNGNDFSNPDGTRLKFSARATDYNGKTSWTYEDLYLDAALGGNSNTNASVGLQASPNQTTFNNGDQVTFNGSAQDADGLARIEVLMNGSVAKTCYYNNSTYWETCGYTTNVYSDGSNSKTFNVAVNAFDRYGNSRGVNPIYYTVNGYTSSNNNSNTNPTTWAWSEPNENLTIATNGNATYHVGAWDQDGLKRIDMYVNGMYANTCNFGSAAYGNRECQITINGSSYKNGDRVYVNAKAVDAFDRESWTTPRTYTISGNGGTTGNNGNATYTWAWATPDVSTVANGQSVTFNVGASDSDGIRKIEIIGNGTVMKTCDLGLAYGNQQCSIAVATTYPGTTYANYYGRVTDGNYATTNSETKSFTITNPTQTTTDKIGTLYAWSSRDNGYRASDTITFTAQGNDSDGIERIELFVNAKLVKTCYGSGTVSCSWIGGPYPDRNTVTYAARMVDKAGHNYITGYKTIDKK